MKIEAFAPSMRPESLWKALQDVKNQKTPVDHIVVVDNGDCDRGKPLSSFKPHNQWLLEFPNLEIVRYFKNIGTNAVWNMALRSDADYIMVFPDDMRFDHYFTKKSIAIMRDPRVAVTSACIIPWEEEIPDLPDSYVCRKIPGHGRAGVFMMRGEFARECPLIPEKFFIFFGDGWIDIHCRFIIKKYWVELKHSCARHVYGSGVSAYLKKSVLRQEKKYWNEIMKGIYPDACRLPVC